MKKQKIIAILISLLIVSTPFAASLKQGIADNGGNDSPIIFGWELAAIISIITSALAVFLLIISFLAYKRERRNRLLYVFIAFSLFAIKGVIYAIYEIFHPPSISLESVALLFDLGILLVLFVGLIKE